MDVSETRRRAKHELTDPDRAFLAQVERQQTIDPFDLGRLRALAASTRDQGDRDRIEGLVRRHDPRTSASTVSAQDQLKAQARRERLARLRAQGVRFPEQVLAAEERRQAAMAPTDPIIAAAERAFERWEARQP